MWNGCRIIMSARQTDRIADLAGFYDPCALLHEEQKHLLIRYSYQNCIHQLLLPDEEAVKMPKTAHRLPDVR